jgi:Tfp pilus assembly protein PilN
MIKVNLLRDHAVRERKAFVKPSVSRTGLIMAAIAVLVVCVMGAWTLYARQQVKKSTLKRDDLHKQELRLQALQQEIEKYKKDKQRSKDRINAIESLKASQTGPVLLLNNVIQSIPRDGILWLTSLTQNADRVKIVGFTQTTEMIPDFMSNLMTCGMFKTVDLEMIDSEKEASKFSLVCTTGKKSQAE